MAQRFSLTTWIGTKRRGVFGALAAGPLLLGAGNVAQAQEDPALAAARMQVPGIAVFLIDSQKLLAGPQAAQPRLFRELVSATGALQGQNAAAAAVIDRLLHMPQVMQGALGALRANPQSTGILSLGKEGCVVFDPGGGRSGTAAYNDFFFRYTGLARSNVRLPDAAGWRALALAHEATHCGDPETDMTLNRSAISADARDALVLRAETKADKGGVAFYERAFGAPVATVMAQMRSIETVRLGPEHATQFGLRGEEGPSFGQMFTARRALERLTPLGSSGRRDADGDDAASWTAFGALKRGLAAGAISDPVAVRLATDYIAAMEYFAPEKARRLSSVNSAPTP